MGGSGSTRWGDYSKKITVEKCLKLSLTEITRAHCQPLHELVGTSGELRWSNGSSISYIVQRENADLQLILSYSVNGEAKKQVIRISHTECYYGGFRYWMHCPRCSRRVGKLYYMGGYATCRQCHDLAYTSAQEAHRFDNLRRLIGEEFGIVDDMLEVQNLLKKWDERKRLTKGERCKIARGLGVPVYIVRNRWYRRDVQKRRTDELVESLFKTLLKKSNNVDTP